jgi:hypothetical protein
MPAARRYLALLVLATASVAEAASLRGSPASMRLQHGVAVKRDFTFLRTPADVRALADKGHLERLTGNADYALAGVSFPYARAEVRVFIERLGAQFREATGSRLVVTSVTRPSTLQPSNSHRLSVHPTGMAIDLRVPADARARRWLESALLGLEGRGVLDATRERRPPHYHVAVFPELYAAYVESLTGQTVADLAQPIAPGEPTAAPSLAPPADVPVHAADDAALPAVMAASMAPPSDLPAFIMALGALLIASGAGVLRVALRRR